MHKGVTKEGLEVAIKIQYPGVADSIESDIDNVKLLLDYTNLIPENLYLDRAMKVTYYIPFLNFFFFTASTAYKNTHINTHKKRQPDSRLLGGFLVGIETFVKYLFQFLFYVWKV